MKTTIGPLCCVGLAAVILIAQKDEQQEFFPYGNPPAVKPSISLSAAMDRVYGTYGARWPQENELFSNFRYTPLEGLGYSNHDGAVSRR